MAWSTPPIVHSSVLVAALLINALSYCSAENVYCVTPTATSCSSCPQNTHCATLSEYAQEAKEYFSSNTTMVMLQGEHVLDTDIIVANVSRLTMYGESSSGNRATVVCSGPVRLSFISMLEFKIHSLGFTSCSRKYDFSPGGNYVLLLESVQYAELVNCSFHNNLGTAIVAINTNVIVSGNSKFAHNHCESSFCTGGGGITALRSSLTFTGNTTFSENNATFNGGGAIYASDNTIISFTGTNNFINNSAYDGGAIYTSDTILSFNGTNYFINNSVYHGVGGAICTLTNAVLSFIGTNNFINNSAYNSLGGAIYTANNISLRFNGFNNFINNSAYDGGAVYTTYNSEISFIGTNHFTSNSAADGDDGGGAIYATDNTALSFSGTNNFTSNSASNDGDGGGGAIYASDNTIFIFNGTNNFISNSADYSSGGAIYTSSSTAFSFNGTSNFINNSAAGGYGGAICADVNTILTFNGTINFIKNGHNINTIDILMTHTACGGGVYLGLKSAFIIFPHSYVYWEHNHANLGGAIYVNDASPLTYCPSVATYIPKEECFFQLPGQNLDVQLVFKNNSAEIAGNVLYGGAIDSCQLIGLDTYTSGEVFDMIFQIEDEPGYNKTSAISSDPFHICVCENSSLICNKYIEIDTFVHPGELFHFSVVAAGQRSGTVPSTVRSTVSSLIPSNHSETSLVDYQYLQSTNNTCTKLNYTAFSLYQVVEIALYPERSPCSKLDDGYEVLALVILNQTCPLGLNFSDSLRSCVCEQRLAYYTGAHQCSIKNSLGQIKRVSSQQFWVGYDQSHGLILHPHCPFDYCVNDTIVFPLNNTDIQCAYNRSGLLCGLCKKGYSLVLGTSHCKQCTNSHLTLLIAFAMMGVALVFLLLICKLTVATGTLSGIVFYANIVGVNRTIFLPGESTDVLSVFIAWLNLDFGIETCFFDGMDAYSKTWLQFAFPVYIWIIVGIMIATSHFSNRFARLLGNNPVPVLATLILLSYTKILRNLIAVIYVTYLEYPTYNSVVWLYDANIDYLSGKHIPLFLVAVLVFLFLFLPYTVLLLCGQWLQALSHRRLFSWINRLKPFMDSYHAPYKAKHRYWPGLLLVLRFVLLLVFAFEYSPQQDTSISLLAILVGAGFLHFWAWISGGVYRNWCLNVLEGSFVLNLIILVGATYHVTLSEGTQLTVAYTSVSIAFAIFVAILAFQLVKMTGMTQYLQRKCTAIAVRYVHQAEDELEPLNADNMPDRLVNPGEYEPPLNTPPRSATAEPTDENELVNGAQRRLIPVYTCDSFVD